MHLPGDRDAGDVFGGHGRMTSKLRHHCRTLLDNLRRVLLVPSFGQSGNVRVVGRRYRAHRRTRLNAIGHRAEGGRADID